MSLARRFNAGNQVDVSSRRVAMVEAVASVVATRRGTSSNLSRPWKAGPNSYRCYAPEIRSYF